MIAHVHPVNGDGAIEQDGVLDGLLYQPSRRKSERMLLWKAERLRQQQR